MHAKRGLVTVKERRSGMRIYGFAFLTKASLLFAGQNDLFYDRYRSYDSFIASVTHCFEVGLRKFLSRLNSKLQSAFFAFRTVLFLIAISPAIVLSSLPHTLIE